MIESQTFEDHFRQDQKANYHFLAFLSPQIGSVYFSENLSILQSNDQEPFQG